MIDDKVSGTYSMIKFRKVPYFIESNTSGFV